MIKKNPWLGLASYEEPKNDGNDNLFCGRDEETLDVVRLVDNNLFVTLYGSSGIGKTSLLRAGVIPILRRKDYFPLYVRLSQEPKEISYAEAIVRKLQNSGLTEESTAEMKHPDGKDRLYLWNYFAITRFFNEGREVYPVIILDQFEEVFREGDKAKAELLLKQIYLLLNDELEMPDEAGYSSDTNYRFVASIREDFLFVLEDSIDENSLDLYKNNRYRLRSMKPEQARQVVLVGKDWIEETEIEKVTERVIELSKGKNRTIDTLLLSLVCASTFNKKTKNRLSRDDFEFWGDNPMRVYYQDAIKQLKAEQVRYIQNNLINKNGSRKRVKKQALKSDLGDELFERLLKGSHRILTLTADGQVELLHDQIALTIFEDRDAYEERIKIKERDKFLRVQSRLVIEKAKDLVEKGDSYLVQKLMLEVLPKNISNPDRPYTIEAEKLLRDAVASDIATFWGHSDRITSVMFSPNGKQIVSASWDKTIRVWNADSGKMLRCLEGHVNRVSFACFSPDGKSVVSAGWEGTIRIWDIKTGNQIQCLEKHTSDVNSALYSPDGKFIVSSSDDKTIRVWDAKSNNQVLQLAGHLASVCFATFSPDSEHIASASKDKTIRVWDVKTSKQILCLEGHSDLVRYVSYSPDGECIASASDDRTIRIWNANTGEEIKCLRGHRDIVFSVAFHKNGEWIISTSADETIRAWNVKTGEQVLCYDGLTKTNMYSFAAFHPDGKRIVIASSDNTIMVSKVGIAEQLICFGERSLPYQFAYFSSDGEHVISASHNNMQMWDASNGKLLGCKEVYSIEVNLTAYSPDKRRLLIPQNHTILIWDFDTGKPIHCLKKHTDAVNSAVFSFDGNRIISASSDCTIRIWDAASGKQIKIIKGHSRVVNSAAFSHDGKRIVSASDDMTVRIWDAETGMELKSLEGHTWSVNSATFSPDDKHIVSASGDRTLRIWDAEIGVELKTLVGHNDIVRSAAFSPDGKRIVSASDDGTIRIWDFPPLQDLIDKTRERFKDCPLTNEERRMYYLE